MNKYEKFQISIRVPLNAVANLEKKVLLGKEGAIDQSSFINSTFAEFFCNFEPFLACNSAKTYPNDFSEQFFL